MKHRTKYGYARESSKDKKAVAQLTALRGVGIPQENTFVDLANERERFVELTELLRSGDMLVIKSLSQLGYNYQEMLKEWKTLTEEQGCHIKVLDLELLDTSIEKKEAKDSFVSELFQQIIAFVAQQERNYIRQRQAEGIANARIQGRHLGRPRIPKPEIFNEIYDIWRAGVISAEEAMIRLGLKRSTFERFVKERKEELRKELQELQDIKERERQEKEKLAKAGSA